VSLRNNAPVKILQKNKFNENANLGQYSEIKLAGFNLNGK
jgi:hypothetical protein